MLLGSGKSSPAAFLDEGEAKKSSRSSLPFAAEAAVKGCGVRIFFFSFLSFLFFLSFVGLDVRGWGSNKVEGSEVGLNCHICAIFARQR